LHKAAITSNSAIAETPRDVFDTIKAEMCRIGDFKAMGHFEAKF